MAVHFTQPGTLTIKDADDRVQTFHLRDVRVSLAEGPPTEVNMSAVLDHLHTDAYITPEPKVWSKVRALVREHFRQFPGMVHAGQDTVDAYIHDLVQQVLEGVDPLCDG